MIKAIIIDDNIDAISYLQNLCEKYLDEILIKGTATSVDQAIKITKNVKPELVFLDIELGDDTGFNYLNKLKDIDFDVIFTTGHQNYAIKAIRYAALDYLLKPINIKELKDAINRFNDNKALSITKHQVVHLLETINSQEPLTRLTIPNMQGCEVVQLEDVLYFKSSGSSTIVQTSDKKFVISRPLKYYADMLNKDFFKTHRKFIVNLNCVKKYYKGDGSYAKMSNGHSVAIAVRLRSAFLKALGY